MGNVPELDPLWRWSHTTASAPQQLPNWSTTLHNATISSKPGAVHPPSSRKAWSQNRATQYFQQGLSAPKQLCQGLAHLPGCKPQAGPPGEMGFATTTPATQSSRSKDQMARAWSAGCLIPPSARLCPHHRAVPAPGQPWRPGLLHAFLSPVIGLKQNISSSFLCKTAQQ